jgi:hypothetical protein
VFRHPLVETLLLVLFGEAAMREREELGSKQPDAFGAVTVDEAQVVQQTRVGG